MVELDIQNPPTTVKTTPQNDNSPPKKDIGVKQQNSIDRLVDYGTDDEDTVEEPPPLRGASFSIELPRSQEVTTEDTRETQTTTTMNDPVVKIESPASNGPKVCAHYWTVPYRLFSDTIIKMGFSGYSVHKCTSPSY